MKIDKDNIEITIAVIIPCYNSARTVGNAIESVLQQTVKVEEIIVVDDGSSDDVKSVLEEYSGKIKYIYQQNGGVSSARNRGIRESKSTWIAFLDADDIWYKAKIEIQKKLIENFNVKWCAGVVTTNTSISKDKTVKQNNSNQVLKFFEAFTKGVSFQTGAFLIRKDLLENVGLYDEKLKISEDRDLWWKIAINEPLIGYANEPIVHYNEFEQFSLMKKSRDRTDSVKALSRLLKEFKKCNDIVNKNVMNYFVWMSFSYLLRHKTKEICVNKTTIDELYGEIRLTTIQKIILLLCKYELPFKMRKRFSYLVQRVMRHEGIFT